MQLVTILKLIRAASSNPGCPGPQRVYSALVAAAKPSTRIVQLRKIRFFIDLLLLPNRVLRALMHPGVGFAESQGSLLRICDRRIMHSPARAARIPYFPCHNRITFISRFHLIRITLQAVEYRSPMAEPHRQWQTFVPKCGQNSYQFPRYRFGPIDVGRAGEIT
jgi:hypothetical protein